MRSNFKLSTWGLVCGVVAQLLVFQDVTLARRIRSLDILGGARVVFYTPEGKEIARFNDTGWEINVPEGEKARRLNNDFLEECFKQYSSLVVKTRLNNSSQLRIAVIRASFGDNHDPNNPYAGLLVEARLVQSLEPGGAVTDLWFLNKDGSRADFARDKNGKEIIDGYGEKVAGHQEFSLIYKAETKELISSYYGGIDEDKIDEYLKNPKYGSLVVKTRLNNSGQLHIAGQRAKFGDAINSDNPYAGLLVEARLVQSLEPGGAVTDLWFLNKDGSRADFARDKNGEEIVDRYGEKVAGHQEFSLIYKAETKELISSYYGWIDGGKIDEYLKNPKYGSLVVKTWLDNSGQLNIAGKRAGFGNGPNLDNPYAGLLVEARLVQSKEKGGAVREVWFYDKEGKLTEKKKFIWVEDKQGNILTSFYKFPREFKLKDGFVFVPENRAGIVPLPEEPIKVYKVKETDLLKLELKDGEIEKVQFQEKPGGPWIMAQWREYLGKSICYRINGDGNLSITSISGRGNVNLSPLKPIELSLAGISGSNTEEKAMQLTERYEESQKREAIRVEKVDEYGPIGYDILSHTQKGISPFEERKIEVKGRTLEDGSIVWTGNEIGTAEVEGKLYYLYIVIINKDKARLYIIQDPFNLLKPYENGG